MFRTTNFLNRILISNFKRLSFPYKLTFAVTYKCNFKCKICSIWKKREKQELELSDIENFFKRNPNFSWIDLTGGEIFLREDIFDIVNVILDTCKSLKILHFPTNGYFTEEIVSLVDRILEYGKVIPVVTVSLNGRKKTDIKIRGVKDCWDRSLETYKRLKKFKKGYFSIGLTLSKYNTINEGICDVVEEIRDKCKFFKIADLHFNLAHRSEHYYKNMELYNIVDKKYIVKQYPDLFLGFNSRLSIKNYLERRYLKGLYRYIVDGHSPLKCQALSASCFIDPYGDVFPCSIYSKKICNIKENGYNLYDIWGNADFLRTYSEIDKGLCEGCWTPCEAYNSILGSILKNGNN